MLDHFAVETFKGVTDERVHFYHPTARRWAVEEFRAFCERPLRPPAPLDVLEVEGAIFFNDVDHQCLYDSEGRRIEASCNVRYAYDFTPEYWRSAPRLPSLGECVEFREPIVFRSLFFNHWGHFLLESIARLWADTLRPELAGLDSLYVMTDGGVEIKKRYAEFLAVAGVRVARPLAPGAHVRFAKCYIPSPSFTMGAYADPAHLEAPRRVTRRLLGPVEHDPRPVYFSRLDPELLGHGWRRMKNEAKLEEALARRGVRIVHMQHLSLAEQISLVHAHDVFIGPWGSAFHNLLFRLDGKPVTTFVLCPAPPPRDFVLVDTLLGNVAHYLFVQFKCESFAQTREMEIDVAATLSYLEHCHAL